MGFFQDITGKTAANASKAAAADTYTKQQDAIRKLLGYGDEYATDMKTLSGAYDPYVATGRTSNDALNRLIADPSSVRSLPGYQFAQSEGVGALDNSAASRGMLNSGRASKDLMRFGTGLADSTYGNQLQRLMGLNQQGMVATGQQVATEGAGLQGQLGARTSAYGGDMTSAGTVGQGDIAAANARAAGSQNLLNAGMNGIGKLAGSGFGGMPGMGAGSSSFMPSTAFMNNDWGW